MAVKDAVTASIVGCINPSLELKREAELGQFSCVREGQRERSREYEVKLIYLDASAAIFMTYRESHCLNFYSSGRLSKVRLS